MLALTSLALDSANKLWCPRTRSQLLIFHQHTRESMFWNLYTLLHPQNDVQLNRKMLSELAIHEPESFKALTQFTRTRMNEAELGLKLLSIN
jgi:ribosomal protein L20